MVLESTNFDLKKEEGCLKHSIESRILIDEFLTFMKTEQKSELSLEELKDQILYFDPTYDDSTISLGGMFITNYQRMFSKLKFKMRADKRY